MFGYKYAYSLLNIVFNRIRKCIGNDGCVLSFNGDILLIILHEIDNKNDAEEIIDRIEMLFSDLMKIEGQNIKLTLKTGISLCSPSSMELENTLKSAEIALDYAKKSYLYNHSFFSFNMLEEITKKGNGRYRLR